MGFLIEIRVFFYENIRNLSKNSLKESTTGIDLDGSRKQTSSKLTLLCADSPLENLN